MMNLILRSFKVLVFAVVLAVVSSLLTACSSDSDFVYGVKPLKPQVVSKSYNLDELKPAYTPKIDVLWIIDNSGSMGPYQQQVIRNAGVFMQEFTVNNELEWKMGLLSSSENEPPYIGFSNGLSLDWKSKDPVSDFQNAVKSLGISSWEDERAFGPLIKHLTRFDDFLTPKAYFALIFVTDEAEQSTQTAQQTYDFLVNIKGVKPEKIIATAVIADRDIGGCGTGSSADKYAGGKYEEFINISQGTFIDLCANNFGTQLGQLGKSLVQKALINTRIILTDRPIASTIKLNYKGVDLPAGSSSSGGVWMYDPVYNIIVIHDPKALDGNIRDILVTYEVDQKYVRGY